MGLEGEILVEVELPQIVGLAAFDEGLVPCEVDKGKARLPIAAFPSRFRKNDAFQDVHVGAYIFFAAIVPPAFVEDQRNAVPTVKG